MKPILPNEPPPSTKRPDPKPILPNEPPPPPPDVAPTDPAPEEREPGAASSPAPAADQPAVSRRGRPSQPSAPGWVPAAEDAVILDRRAEIPPASLAPLRQGPATVVSRRNLGAARADAGPFSGAAILLTGH